jgi:hypothetical protein
MSERKQLGFLDRGEAAPKNNFVLDLDIQTIFWNSMRDRQVNLTTFDGSCRVRAVEAQCRTAHETAPATMHEAEHV